MRNRCGVAAVLVLGSVAIASVALEPLAHGQSQNFASGTLDPTRNISQPARQSASVEPLPEQYIWTSETGSGGGSSASAGQGGSQQAARYFRRSFRVDHVPAHATLYVAGPRSVQIYLNGRLVLEDASNPSSPLILHVFTADVSKSLHPGQNLLAMRVSRGRGFVMSPGMDQVVVAKIVPAARGESAPPIVVTDADWKGSVSAESGWQQPDFHDAAWTRVHAFGPINGSIDYLQWNLDAGLYAWPGYAGVSPFLARYQLPAARVQQVFAGASKLDNVNALTAASAAPAGQEFTVTLARPSMMEQDAPSIVLDFGKEVVGWLELASDVSHPSLVTVQYGESEGEMEHEPYLGIDPVYVPAHGIAHGPKSAFRYAKVRFLQADGPMVFRSIRLNGIYYPVQYRGSFESSDAMLNRIWEVGAYTAHLCMQDDIWDAPKRDRGRWMGDLDVSGDVIDSVFADQFLMQDTMTRLIGEPPVKQDVNGIPGYSAFWVMGLADYDRHLGGKDYVTAMHDRMVQLLRYMESELDADHLYANPTKAWPFVDWSPYLNGDTPEARMATSFEFYKAFVHGAKLLRQLGDAPNAEHFESLAAQMKQAAERKYLDPRTGTFGNRWQTNAMAIYSGLADSAQYGPIWKNVLSTVNTTQYTALVITPYYNYYVISAMAETGHRREALDWIRKYWGGMIAEGATSFWEAYDPTWFKHNFHASLQADNGTGYFVSLAHGWSTGPTAWLMEQILGIQPTSEGFRDVTIRPDLAGLGWAKGAEPTPFGLIRVSLKSDAASPIALDLPDGIHATVLVPAAAGTHTVRVNGKSVEGTAEEDGHRLAVVLDHGGHYELTSGS